MAFNLETLGDQAGRVINHFKWKQDFCSVWGKNISSGLELEGTQKEKKKKTGCPAKFPFQIYHCI